jgi:hypothetical protein
VDEKVGHPQPDRSHHVGRTTAGEAPHQDPIKLSSEDQGRSRVAMGRASQPNCILALLTDTGPARAQQLEQHVEGVTFHRSRLFIGCAPERPAQILSRATVGFLQRAPAPLARVGHGRGAAAQSKLEQSRV